MIPRYTRPEMGALWTDEAKLATWVEVEVLACEAHAELGVVPAQDLAAIREGVAPTPKRVREIEARTDHDVIAFLTAFSETIPDPDGTSPGRWVHYGMTSSDLVDTALGATLARATDLVLAGADRLVAALKARALEHWDTLCAGRTHGVHAEPTTFGHKLAGWAFELSRDRDRLRTARDGVAVGKLSGAVGSYSQLDPEVESYVCDRLGLAIEPAATQVTARDRHAEFLSAVALTGAALERFAQEIRHLQRTEVREVREPFAEGQRGSSAMPHKRNPIVSERICGLARLLRGYAMTGYENVALWHERDISHSSVERITLGDACILLDYMLDKMRWVIDGLVVDAKRMRHNLDESYGLVHSQSVLTALLASGNLQREEAYALVQRNAMTAWDEGRPLIELLKSDPEVTAHLDPAEIESCFDEARCLRHAHVIFERLENL